MLPRRSHSTYLAFPRVGTTCGHRGYPSNLKIWQEERQHDSDSSSINVGIPSLVEGMNQPSSANTANDRLYVRVLDDGGQGPGSCPIHPPRPGQHASSGFLPRSFLSALLFSVKKSNSARCLALTCHSWCVVAPFRHARPTDPQTDHAPGRLRAACLARLNRVVWF